MMPFINELTELLNKHNYDTTLGVADHEIAAYVTEQLDLLGKTIRRARAYELVESKCEVFVNES